MWRRSRYERDAVLWRCLCDATRKPIFDTKWPCTYRDRWVGVPGGNCSSRTHGPGLANFNPHEGHTIRKDSPEGRTCLYIYRKWGLGGGMNWNAVKICTLQGLYAAYSAGSLKTRTIGCPETSVRNYHLRCVKPQWTANRIVIVAEAWNHAQKAVSLQTRDFDNCCCLRLPC
jgi:hypothetical protein